ncbi:alpha/beta fold hydrolase [Streptomyces sp. NPDC058457]|uniref:alpha/beta fold hydrolase n=1 Tax=Streptomyces sp. NPDC058457 TaxID=3346507 RepID=UPI00364E7F97
MSSATSSAMSPDATPPAYTPPPPRIRAGLDDAAGRLSGVDALLAELPKTPPRAPDADGDEEKLGAVTVTHRFADAPGDGDTVRWHYVECGPADAPVVVFLHGVPDSWWQWHYALEALGTEHRCLAVDLKGYGQSEKGTGDFRQEGVAIQLEALLDRLRIERFSLVTHDRGTPVGDHLVARMGHRVVRYGRGQQHLWHLHPDLHPQEALFTSPDAPGTLADARRFVALAYTLLTERPVRSPDLVRTVQEFGYQGISTAVPRYFHSSSFRQEWIERRTRLIPRWTCPVLLLQGADDPVQPREFYTDPQVLARLPRGSAVHLFDSGHFWPFEAPEEMTTVLREFLGQDPAGIGPAAG